MATYIALQIEKGSLAYNVIVPLYPQFKAGVDSILVAKGLGHLIVE